MPGNEAHSVLALARKMQSGERVRETMRDVLELVYVVEVHCEDPCMV